MSNTTSTTFDPISAAESNASNAEKLGWYRNLPPMAVSDWPGLAADCLAGAGARALFACEVFAYQTKTRHLDADGKLGQSTYDALMAQYTAARVFGEYVIHKNQQRAAKATTYNLITCDEIGGLELASGGDYTSYKAKPERVVNKILLHWGGHDARGCRDILFNRDLSSHFGVSEGDAFQWLDTGHHAWHASWANENTIGIDVCQQPTIGNLQRYLDRGLDVRIIDNPAVRESGQVVGDRQVLTLHTETAQTLYSLCETLCETFGIPFEIPRLDDGRVSHESMTQAEFTEYRGILCHSHVSTSGKWDVSPWLGQVFGGQP